MAKKRKPTVGDYLRTAGDVLVTDPRNSALATMGRAAYDYLSDATPESVVEDIKGGFRNARDWAKREAPAFRAAPIRETLKLAKSGYIDPLVEPFNVFQRAAQTRAAGNTEGGRRMAAMVPLAVMGAVNPELRGAGKLAVREGVQAAEKAAIRAGEKAATAAVEKKPARAIQRFAAARTGPRETPRPLAHERAPLPEVAPALPSSVSGSFDAAENVPLTYKGLQPWELTSNQMADMGEALGVENLGPLNAPQSFPYEAAGGDRFEIPGGLEGKFTYEDMLAMKAAGINPARIDPDLHRAIQQKLMRSMDEGSGLSDAKVLSGLTFGYTSPNNPLTPNQLATSRLRMASQEDLDRIIKSRPWELTDAVTADQRGAFSDELANRLGLGAASKGGLGVRGSVDYSGYTDMLDLFRRDPSFFHRGKDEPWTGFVERVASQVPGLSNKTGSFGVAWQPEAGVSAIDRHMANEYMDTILGNPEKRAAFEARALNLAAARAAKEGKTAPARFEDLNHGLIQELLLSEVGNSPTPKFRVKSGEINPAVPEHLAVTDWISEPEKAELMGQTYKDVVDANEAAMAGSGLHLFGNQWNIWDRIRQRLEPHENMFPGLERVPRMSVEQMRVVDAQHGLSGHKNYSKDAESRLQPTRAVDPKRFRYFSKGGFAVGKKQTQRLAVRK